jgi:hypothetical protein
LSQGALRADEKEYILKRENARELYVRARINISSLPWRKGVRGRGFKL